MCRFFDHAKKTLIAFSSVLSFCAGPTVASELQRLDLYDGSDNHIMYMTFAYTQDGRNVGRTMYMADGTFMRTVVILYDDAGHRSNEVSYNFNGDVVYSTKYLEAENGGSFSLLDQFNLDVAGDRVVYTSSDLMNFTLGYEQSGAQAATIRYEKNASDGRLERVTISGPNSRDSYYGLFTYGEPAGISGSMAKRDKHPTVSVQTGASGIFMTFNLGKPSNVRCELLTLSGRRAALLFNGNMQAGRQTRRFHSDRSAGLIADGVYILRISVDGTNVSCSRFLSQASAIAGGSR